MKKFSPFIALLLLSQLCFAQFKTTLTITDLENKQLTSVMEANASEFLSAINVACLNNTKPKLNSKALTTEAISSVLSSWELSSFRCTETKIIESAIYRKTDGKYEVRNIPLFFKKADNEYSNEEAVLTFLPNGKIDGYNISLVSNRIITKGSDVTDERMRLLIIDALENFRTAYNKKDINTIEDYYSEDALIITGKERKRVKVDNQKMSDNVIEYTKQTKEEYVKKLKNIFNSNSYINIKFEDIEITRDEQYNFAYGVILKQKWHTSNYSDEGYLFLYFNFSDEDAPKIHCRTWQPSSIKNEDIMTKDKYKTIYKIGK
jgi:ketosteroid isomerase-like protein